MGGITLSLRGVIRDAIQTRGPSYRISTQQNPMTNLFRIVRDAKSLSKSITKELQFTSPSEVPDSSDLDALARKLLLDRNIGNKPPPSCWREKFASALETLLPVYGKFQTEELMKLDDKERAKFLRNLGPEEMERMREDMKVRDKLDWRNV